MRGSLSWNYTVKKELSAPDAYTFIHGKEFKISGGITSNFDVFERKMPFQMQKKYIVCIFPINQIWSDQLPVSSGSIFLGLEPGFSRSQEFPGKSGINSEELPRLFLQCSALWPHLYSYNLSANENDICILINSTCKIIVKGIQDLHLSLTT